MNIQKLALDSFYYEWMRLRAKPGAKRRGQSFLTALENRAEVESEVGSAVQQRNIIFDLDAVQKKIDSDLQDYKGVDRRRRSRYHQMNLRFLSRMYAHKLYFVTKGASPDLEAMRKAFHLMKSEINCPLYPCHKVL